MRVTVSSGMAAKVTAELTPDVGNTIDKRIQNACLLQQNSAHLSIDVALLHTTSVHVNALYCQYYD